MRTHLALVPLLFLAPACFISRDTFNEALVEQKIAALVPGTSKASDVTAALGAPAEVVQLGLSKAYRYDYTVTKRSGFSVIIVTFINTDVRQDRCWLFFDGDDVLTHLGTTLDAADAVYAMPWDDSE